MKSLAGILLAVGLLTACGSASGRAGGDSVGGAQSGSAGGDQATSAPIGVPLPATGAWVHPVPLGSDIYIRQLSCVPGMTCFAGNEVGDILRSTAMGSWQVVYHLQGGNALSVSCVSADFCAATDGFGLYVYSGGSWATYTTTDTGPMESVSCASATFCMAVDDNGMSYAFTGSATRWSRGEISPGENPRWVSCPTSNFCATVTNSGNIYTYDGKQWKHVDGIDDQHTFMEVSCSSVNFCVAVDNYLKAAVMAGGHWSLVDNPSDVTVISCPADGYCVGSDQDGVVYYVRGNWSRTYFVAGRKIVLNLDCAAVNACAVLDGTAASQETRYYTTG